ncbi:MAG: hypothetical protein JWM96_309, partial [Alphaproteobacteria bacterium]|nr:hypothetical protein [Alphaproteobacteria bacterium]
MVKAAGQGDLMSASIEEDIIKETLNRVSLDLELNTPDIAPEIVLGFQNKVAPVLKKFQRHGNHQFVTFSVHASNKGVEFGPDTFSAFKQAAHELRLKPENFLNVDPETLAKGAHVQL